jgi:hypothetical protein
MACTFATSDASIATIAGKGASAVLTPVAAGSLTVRVTCASVSGSTTVTVEPALDAGPDHAGDDATSRTEASSDANEGDGTSVIDGAEDIETSGIDDAGDGG